MLNLWNFQIKNKNSNLFYDNDRFLDYDEPETKKLHVDIQKQERNTKLDNSKELQNRQTIDDDTWHQYVRNYAANTWEDENGYAEACNKSQNESIGNYEENTVYAQSINRRFGDELWFRCNQDNIDECNNNCGNSNNCHNRCCNDCNCNNNCCNGCVCDNCCCNDCSCSTCCCLIGPTGPTGPIGPQGITGPTGAPGETIQMRGIQAQLLNGTNNIIPINGNVLFDNVLNNQSLNILYNSITGEFTINSTGNYFVSWSVSTDGAGAGTSVSFGIAKDNIVYSNIASPLVTGEVSGTALVTIGPNPTVITLVNTSGNAITLGTVPVKANIVIVQIAP